MNLENYSFLKIVVLSNSLLDYLTAVAVFFVSLFVLKIFQIIIIKNLKKMAKRTKNGIDDLLIDRLYEIHWPFYVIISLNIASRFLVLKSFLQKSLYFLLLCIVFYYLVLVIEKFLDKWLESVISKKEKEGQDAGIVHFMGIVIKVCLWIAVVLLIISNLGFNITTLIAGFGVGGIAVAFALQNVLGDIFSSISIYFDKPFKVGDLIYIGTNGGVVKKIGIKSTRIEMLQGDELIISNTELTKTQVRNYEKIKRRRAEINLGVTYNTPSKKLKKIPEIVKNIVAKYELIDLDRVFFTNFADSSLVFQIIIFANTGDYKEYLEIQHKINIDLVEAFEKEKIEFAYPTQTVYVKK